MPFPPVLTLPCLVDLTLRLIINILKMLTKYLCVFEKWCLCLIVHVSKVDQGCFTPVEIPISDGHDDVVFLLEYSV